MGIIGSLKAILSSKKQSRKVERMIVAISDFEIEFCVYAQLNDRYFQSP